MMLRSYLILFLLFAVSLSSQAQSDMEDVVYLKNGGVTRGVILEMIPDSTIKIQTKDRSIFVYTFKEILKVVKENVPAQEKPVETVTDPYDSKIEYVEIQPSTAAAEPTPKEEYKVSGYHGIIKFGPLGINTFNVNVINGYQFNPYILLGLGIGLDTYKNIGNSVLTSEEDPFVGSATKQRVDYFIPVYMDFRFHVSSSKATFFTYINLGYSFYNGGSGGLDTASVLSSSSSYYSNYETKFLVENGGTFFCPGIGFKVFITKRVGIVADFGLKFQTYQAKSYEVDNTYNSGTGYTDKYVYAGTLNKIAVSPMINFGIAF